ncbi:flavodoxin, partial [uncultured Parasutterella sp.]|uniref:flavodoxin n=1 Tax=uncultured Parasutterella sp. TaxID=1263098 RepID=UPI0025F85305
MINRRTFTLFSMCAAAGVSGLANAQAAKKPKILVVYFSKTNHTKNIADTIARLTGADERRVEVVKPYPEAYRPTTQIVKEELEKGIVREIKAPEVDLSKYDVIIFGTPTWWHHVAMPLQTWIKAHPMQGKTIATYNTDGGGGTMHPEFPLLDNKYRSGNFYTQSLHKQTVLFGDL